jgi:hypothetical protein
MHIHMYSQAHTHIQVMHKTRRASALCLRALSCLSAGQISQVARLSGEAQLAKIQQELQRLRQLEQVAQIQVLHTSLFKCSVLRAL